MNALRQQVNDLSGGKSAAELVADVAHKAFSRKQPDVHVHLEPGAIQVPVEIDARTMPGAMQHSTPVTIAEGAVHVTNEAPKPASFDIVRGADGITGVRPR